MIVLGLNGYLNADHDASAALVVDGVVVAVVEEERLTRRKRAPGMSPANAAAEVLSVACVKAEDIDVIAYPWRPDLLGESSDQERRRIVQDLRGRGIDINPDLPVEFVQHHESHAWSGLVFVDPERREGCQILVLDGSGEDSSGGTFRFDGAHLVADEVFSVESSAGAMYEAATGLAGFGWGEEGKLMGLSSYVERGMLPSSDVEWLKRCIAREETGQRRAVTDELYAAALVRWNQLVSARAGDRHGTFIGRAFVAALTQAALEERIAELVGAFRSRTVVLAGGTALNCTSNGKLAVTLQREKRELVVPPCANDSGVALGAAVAVAARTDVIGHVESAHLGRSLSIADAADLAAREGATLCEAGSTDVAERLAEGQVLGWLDGRAEVGPRALGGRCIMADPSSTRVRDVLNVMKGRETWRPLAPSVSLSEFDRSFSGVPNAFMLQAAAVREDAVGLDGVTHVDGTARPQVVDHTQAAYLSVITRLGEIRNGPHAVICTSFNRAGEPIVYSMDDGLCSARGMGLHALAGDGWLIELEGPGGR
ncbi:carbamoyltransferase C-terminal domain-containing protein [Micrococcus sp. FDAARGOS_333]|uniref:carbamoyltransferase C-terminal domain-containing protein n=1 Tax=Micrococcus sp. FDAARGOS_333 TaxID=1930558 RepID=UPI000C9E6495|nr:carbamoyltransferase C-terminal domain-containing protein [Micrococcus sp. FDAARGOS_333]PNL17586.1 hypothetical protein CEQ11_005195 [Micrococcus sp. FDAARGOS_333]